MNEQAPRDMTKDQLKVLALTQSIGNITSKYEEQIANMRAEWTQAEGAFQNALKQQESELEKLQEQLKKYQEAEKDVQVEEDTKSAK